VPSSDFKKALARLSDKEKEALVLRAVRRDAELYDTFAFELLPDSTLEGVYETSADRIHELFNVAVTGRLLNRSLVKALRAALQEAARARRGQGKLCKIVCPSERSEAIASVQPRQAGAIASLRSQ
nr:hypothetical protein [Tanacetum cinerariifolium]